MISSWYLLQFFIDEKHYAMNVGYWSKSISWKYFIFHKMTLKLYFMKCPERKISRCILCFSCKYREIFKNTSGECFWPFKLPQFRIALCWVKIKRRLHFHAATHVISPWRFNSHHYIINFQNQLGYLLSILIVIMI